MFKRRLQPQDTKKGSQRYDAPASVESTAEDQMIDQSNQSMREQLLQRTAEDTVIQRRLGFIPEHPNQEHLNITVGDAGWGEFSDPVKNQIFENRLNFTRRIELERPIPTYLSEENDVALIRQRELPIPVGQVDHIIPHRFGGSNHPGNARLLAARQNTNRNRRENRSWASVPDVQILRTGFGEEEIITNFADYRSKRTPRVQNHAGSRRALSVSTREYISDQEHVRHFDRFVLDAVENGKFPRAAASGAAASGAAASGAAAAAASAAAMGVQSGPSTSPVFGGSADHGLRPTSPDPPTASFAGGLFLPSSGVGIGNAPTASGAAAMGVQSGPSVGLGSMGLANPGLGPTFLDPPPASFMGRLSAPSSNTGFWPPPVAAADEPRPMQIWLSGNPPASTAAGPGAAGDARSISSDDGILGSAPRARGTFDISNHLEDTRSEGSLDSRPAFSVHDDGDWPLLPPPQPTQVFGSMEALGSNPSAGNGVLSGPIGNPWQSQPTHGNGMSPHVPSNPWGHLWGGSG